MADQVEQRKANEVVAPTLFVGVGGTGCKIVKGVSQLCIDEELNNVNFLCLDTNVNDLLEITKGMRNAYIIQTSNTQTVGSYLDYDDDARKKWFPKNAVMYDKTVSEGAGQVRAISRLALNTTIKTGRIAPLYRAIDELFRKTGQEMKQAMRVVIATTASGGTGSGIILPLSMFIRDYVKEKYPNTSLIVRSLVLLPETLDSVIKSQTERDSQARNAYATVKEINAFMMKGSGFIDLDEDLKQFSGLGVDVPVAGSDRQKNLSLLPVDFCFLMDGQDAEDSTMVSLGQYIKQASQALYEQSIGPMQKKAFSVEDNIIKEMTKPGNYGRNRFGGIGAGVLCYPYERIVEYVASDLAKDSIGGEGDAVKWTIYDKYVKNKHAELKKQGVPSTEWPTESELFTSKLITSDDAFSKELRDTYNLAQIDTKIEEYKSSLEEELAKVVLQDKDISAAFNTATSQNRNSFGDGEGNIVAAANAMKRFRQKIQETDRSGKPKLVGNVQRWAEGVFTNDQKTEVRDVEFSIENIVKDKNNGVFHPCALRYALYKLLDAIQEEIDADGKGTALNSVKQLQNKIYTYKFKKGEIKGVEELGKFVKESPSFIDKMKQYKSFLEDADTDIHGYYAALNKYMIALAKDAVYEKAREYIKEFIEQYKDFFNGFVDKVKQLDRKKTDLVDELTYQKGDSWVNICATKELLEELSKHSLQKIQKESTMLSSKVNGAVFDAVKQNAIFDLEVKKVGSAFIEENRHVDIFNDILFDYFRNSVFEKCDDINLDIIRALELELRLAKRIKMNNANSDKEPVYEQISNEEAKQYILKAIEMGQRIAAPSVQRVTNEEPREINVCAYNRILTENRKYRVKDLMPNGEAVDTVSKYEIHFYNALYNLTPDKIKKFAAPFDTETGHKNAGTYHRAYSEYSKLIGPDSTKNAAISTHIDKRWDSIKCMPELDFNYQQQVIMRIHKAFIYGIVHRAIQQRALSDVANGKKVFIYRNSENRDVELVVPNGTLCDEFYEILDALYVNSKVVEDIGIIKGRKRAMSEAKNCNYEDTEFFKDMAAFDIFNFRQDAKKYDKEPKVYDDTAESLKELKDHLRENKEERAKKMEAAREAGKPDSEAMVDDKKTYVENRTSLFTIPLLYYCSLPNSGRFISEITMMVEAVIDVFREEFTKWEKPEDVKFVLCNRLTDELNLLNRNYDYFHEVMHAPAALDNPVIDIIQRKIRDVIMSAPEPEDYETLLDRMAKEFKDQQK